MKKMIGILLTAILLASPLFAKEKKPFPAIQQVIPLTELSSEQIQELVLGQHPDIAVECSAGTSLPFRFLFNFKFFSASLDPNLTVKVDESFYLRFNGKKVYVSTDLINWSNLSSYIGGPTTTNLKIGDDARLLVETNLLQD